MNSEYKVRAALQALAEHDRSCQSQMPAHLIFARHRPRKWNFGTVFGAIGVAAAAMLAAILMNPSPNVPAPRAPEPPSQVAIAQSEIIAPEVTIVSAVPVKHTKRVAPKPQPREVVTDFFPLMDVPPPFERGQLLRVVVPASTMRTVGLPVNPDRLSERVQADVLVGEEGMARAIRFVSYEQ
jgi:hypothetical protein